MKSPIEPALDGIASIWFGVCVGLSLWLWAAAAGVNPALGSLAAGGASSLAVFILLRRAGGSDYPLSAFALAPIEVEEPEELLLLDVVTSAAPLEELRLELEQRLGLENPLDELLLDDPLAALDTDSRVIRLFDPAAMPTAGQLQNRIELHLRNREAPAYPDAAQALNDALADLRRSLR